MILVVTEIFGYGRDDILSRNYQKYVYNTLRRSTEANSTPRRWNFFGSCSNVKKSVERYTMLPKGIERSSLDLSGNFSAHWSFSTPVALTQSLSLCDCPLLSTKHPSVSVISSHAPLSGKANTLAKAYLRSIQVDLKNIFVSSASYMWYVDIY